MTKLKCYKCGKRRIKVFGWCYTCLKKYNLERVKLNQKTRGEGMKPYEVGAISVGIFSIFGGVIANDSFIALTGIIIMYLMLIYGRLTLLTGRKGK